MATTVTFVIFIFINIIYISLISHLFKKYRDVENLSIEYKLRWEAAERHARELNIRLNSYSKQALHSNKKSKSTQTKRY